MLRRLPLLALAIAAGAGPAAAGVFRCVEANGHVRFVDSPHACANARAESHAIRGRIEKTPSRSLPTGQAPGAGVDVWPSRAELAAAWEVVREAPVDVGGDPDLVEWGVRDQDVRHFTRDVGGRVQVCSVEIWRFTDAARARAAQQGFAHPGWRIEQAGDRVVMLRGLTLARGATPQRGIFADCRSLGEGILERARAVPAAAGGRPTPP